jgi:hypothetical protein
MRALIVTGSVMWKKTLKITLMLEEVSSSEMLANIYQTTECNIFMLVVMRTSTLIA